MGYPATTKPPRFCSRRSFASRFYPRRSRYSLARYRRRTLILHLKHCAKHRLGRGPLGPLPGLVCAFFYPPVFEF